MTETSLRRPPREPTTDEKIEAAFQKVMDHIRENKIEISRLSERVRALEYQTGMSDPGDI